MATTPALPDEHQFTITTPDKHHLAAVLHVPKKKAKGLVILSHGYTGNKSENGRLFVTTARSLAAAGLAVLRFDFWGSGDSSGEFYQMTPNTEISDLKNVIRWAHQQGWNNIGLLGVSFGGAVSICTLSQIPADAVQALVTWSSVPSFQFWRSTPDIAPELSADLNPMHVSGKKFFTDRPKVDVPEAYVRLDLPKLQIQGDNDIPGFREEFSKYFPVTRGVKKHVIIPGGDHVFTTWKHRKQVIALTTQWFVKYLG